MAFSNLKYIGQSKYKYVTIYLDVSTGKTHYRGVKKATKTTASNCKFFTDERIAAVWVDKQLIEQGLEPVNILKKKQL